MFSGSAGVHLHAQVRGVTPAASRPRLYKKVPGRVPSGVNHTDARGCRGNVDANPAFYLRTSSSSTSNTSDAPGGMTSPAPSLP